MRQLTEAIWCIYASVKGDIMVAINGLPPIRQ